MHREAKDKRISYRADCVGLPPFISTGINMISKTKIFGLCNNHKDNNMDNCGKPQYVESSLFRTTLSMIPQDVGAIKEKASYSSHLDLQNTPATGTFLQKQWQ